MISTKSRLAASFAQSTSSATSSNAIPASAPEVPAIDPSPAAVEQNRADATRTRQQHSQQTSPPQNVARPASGKSPPKQRTSRPPSPALDSATSSARAPLPLSTRSKHAHIPAKPASLAAPAQLLGELPEEVKDLDTDATACRYCGVSYLLLHEVERMKKYVAAVEDKLVGLEHYAEERPAVLARLAELERLLSSKTAEMDKTKRDNEAILADMAHAREREMFQIREREEMRQRIDGLVEETSALSSRLTLAESTNSAYKLQLAQLRSAASHALEGLRADREDLDRERAEVRDTLAAFPATIPALRIALLSSLQNAVATARQHAESALRTELAHSHAAELAEAVRVVREEGWVEGREEARREFLCERKRDLAAVEAERVHWTQNRANLEARLEAVEAERDALAQRVEKVERDRDEAVGERDGERERCEVVVRECEERERRSQDLAISAESRVAEADERVRVAETEARGVKRKAEDAEKYKIMCAKLESAVGAMKRELLTQSTDHAAALSRAETRSTELARQVAERERRCGEMERRVVEVQAQLDAVQARQRDAEREAAVMREREKKVLASKDMELHRLTTLNHTLERDLHARSAELAAMSAMHQKRAGDMQERVEEIVQEARREEQDRCEREAEERAKRERGEGERRGREEAEKAFAATRSSLLRDLHHTQSLLSQLESSHSLALTHLRREHDARTSALRAQLAAEQDLRRQEASAAASRVAGLEVDIERCREFTEESVGDAGRRAKDAETRARRAEEELARAMETVKVECEERAGLIGTIEKLRARLAEGGGGGVGVQPVVGNGGGQAWGARTPVASAERSVSRQGSVGPPSRAATATPTRLSGGSHPSALPPAPLSRGPSRTPDLESETVEGAFERMAGAVAAARARAVRRGRGR
ncbi:hypothetical protein M427DRAFT_70090 [Gonapodya prolifera JEL478]|uniref:Uncharacterized protein n=1 Tax=Gonapodya prolifera (strain JEL478) TaxID=1344416 RepID=A0A139AEH6_GONPJ|nr:hypothetical protein M427DRAFT_70090 [Gonapodya prolifera JEL478]|eukprot:KXS15226.1 hypothetical protein M427DRAFT_70090 [Gonapodya prolifera JEL478]